MSTTPPPTAETGAPPQAWTASLGWYAAARAVYQDGHEVTLLEGGQSLFPAMARALAGAHHEVWVATYILAEDSAAAQVLAALRRAAVRGVRVRLVVDGFGSLAALDWLAAQLHGSGVDWVVFRPLRRWWHWLQPSQLRRLHQKLCVVDGQVAFVGGINLIDDCHDLTHGWSEAPRLDLAVRLEGPVALAVEQTVRAVWTRAMFGHDWRQEVVQLWRAAEPLHQARALWRQVRMVLPRPEAAAGPAVEATPGSAPSLGVSAAFVVRDNLRQRRTIERTMIEAIHQSQASIDLVTPYFYPGRVFRRVLLRAARRGVRVRLLLQGKLDYQLAGWAARALYAELLAEGVEIHEYTAAHLHAKAVGVDGRWATVGSSNVDPLSLLLNLEANSVVRDAAFAAGLRAWFDRALQGARQVAPAARPRGWRAWLGRVVVAWVARIYLRTAGLTGRY
ncbi:cardiolipin synthase ClsB [Ideonella livida]|uniref:Cardiolipin synthase B n=1 Tax=Ideonella livida TaxID=2707176 RepID=A0A7C9THX7_9BURK|nr:cardiolipin synthase ClsB [Ideonella livida]NDY89843.1 cardiolipin synthase ClsB [Ideonella livida]